MSSPPKTGSPSQVLLSMGGLVGKEVNLDEFLATLVDRVATSMQADRGTLYLLDPARQELFSRAAQGLALKQIRLKIGQGVAGQVAKHDTLVNVPNSRSERRFFAEIDKLTGYQTSSLLAVPLRDHMGEVYGVLQVLNRRGADRFSQEDEQRLTQMAQEIGVALEATSLYQELKRAKEQPQTPVGYFFNRIIGESASMRTIYRKIQKVAATEATVLIRGESGVGKELFARAVHVNSPRRTRPFVKVDCAALPAALIENELFGHEKGAFTGADHRMEGKFESANGGTVFIDELGELPLSVQGKLLRVLQDREFDRVGGTHTVQVDVRIVAATNRDLKKMVKKGRFREDLYYRIRVVEVEVPPLRERGGDDVERLARHFVAMFAKKHRLRQPPRISPAALERLKSYHWPGNVRELENCIETALVLCEEGELFEDHLSLPDCASDSSPRRRPPPDTSTILPLAEVERRHVLRAISVCRGNHSAAAKALGIARNTLIRMLRDHGIADDEEGDEEDDEDKD